MRVDVETVREIMAKRDEINAAKLEDMEVYEGGRPIAIPAESVKEWAFTGLNNIDFIADRGWQIVWSEEVL